MRRRILPPSLTALNTPKGRNYLMQALQQQTAAAYIPLTEHFHNQSDPAFCGVTSLQMVLNAFCVDPNIRWRGGWRYYGDDETVLQHCCLTMERVRRVGITLDEFARLGKCKGLTVVMHRPVAREPTTVSSHDDDDNVKKDANATTKSSSSTLEDFRQDVQRMLCQHHRNCGHALEHSMTGAIVCSFGRAALGQTGEGHFSPLAAYHAATDQVLVLDVARFKYQPYWVSVTDLYRSMECVDPVTLQPRGWFLLFPPQAARTHHATSATVDTNDNENDNQNENDDDVDTWQWPGAVVQSEDRRPAHLVPTIGTKSPCPVNAVKVDYCAAAARSDRGPPPLPLLPRKR